MKHDILKTTQGFTLTMWDVKINLGTETNGTELLFYLNYVGCKER